MKYINAEHLKTEIVKLKNGLKSLMNKVYYAANYKEWEAELNGYNKILSLINSLQQEQPKVDFEKELEEAARRYKPNGDFGWGTLYNIAYHFYELGQCNARKEE